jgi:hypothetical protein
MSLYNIQVLYFLNQPNVTHLDPLVWQSSIANHTLALTKMSYLKILIMGVRSQK